MQNQVDNSVYQTINFHVSIEIKDKWR